MRRDTCAIFTRAQVSDAKKPATCNAKADHQGRARQARELAGRSVWCLPRLERARAAMCKRPNAPGQEGQMQKQRPAREPSRSLNRTRHRRRLGAIFHPKVWAYVARADVHSLLVKAVRPYRDNAGLGVEGKIACRRDVEHVKAPAASFWIVAGMQKLERGRYRAPLGSLQRRPSGSKDSRPRRCCT